MYGRGVINENNKCIAMVGGHSLGHGKLEPNGANNTIFHCAQLW